MTTGGFHFLGDFSLSLSTYRTSSPSDARLFSLLLRGISEPAATATATADDDAAAAVDAKPSSSSRSGRGNRRRRGGDRVLRVSGKGRERARTLRGLSDARLGAAGALGRGLGSRARQPLRRCGRFFGVLACLSCHETMMMLTFNRARRTE